MLGGDEYKTVTISLCVSQFHAVLAGKDINIEIKKISIKLLFLFIFITLLNDM